MPWLVVGVASSLRGLRRHAHKSSKKYYFVVYVLQNVLLTGEALVKEAKVRKEEAGTRGSGGGGGISFCIGKLI